MIILIESQNRPWMHSRDVIFSLILPVDAECVPKVTVFTTAPGEINFNDEPQSTPLGQGQVDGGGTTPGCDREWILIPPKDRYVAVTVVSVYNITCGDLLYISSHLSDTRSPGWSVCDFRGGNTPRLFDQPRYLASHREEKIIIQYRRGSSNFSGGRGFEIVYDFKEPGCNGQAVLTGSPSWLATHPGAGAWAVEADLHCAWQIVAPPDQFVSIHSHNVWLHCSSKWQTLEVYDAPKELSSALMARIYCTDQMVSVASSGRYMFLKYDDRWASNSLGFNLTYQFHKRRQCGCGGDYELTAPTGTLLSHKDFDSSDGMLVRQKYLPWSRCQWLIRMPATALVTLRFDHFDVRGKSSAGLCYGDMLVVHDGSSNRTIGQTFCDSYQEPFSLTSTSSRLGVRFLTGPMESMDTRGTGFILTHFG
ncbi:cubilin-like [Lingula anatina]|uniref:Cubilin-like n=1 Tax=Lingula anatina TaxID=7574 RepID=A0A1S3IFZ1_LINAN|nr:cubilin-like [Lingula anatina]|eukprot:XP_013396389.1 cubilin-like [Lingula anatina]